MQLKAAQGSPTRKRSPASLLGAAVVVLLAPMVHAEEESDGDESGAESSEEASADTDSEAERDAEDDAQDSSGAATEPAAKPAPKDEIEDAATYRVSSEFATYADSDHVTVFTPSVSAGIENVSGASLHANYLIDIVSAASVDIVSTASPRWQEVRHAGGLSAEYKPHELGVGVGGSVSSEPDYLSYGGFVRMSKDFDEKNWTLYFGSGISYDTIKRCGGTLGECSPDDVFSREVLRGSFTGGVDFVVDRLSLASLSGDFMVEYGDQSKPYRYVPLFSPAVAGTVPKGASVEWVNSHRAAERPLEQLPLSRKRLALTGRYARRLGGSTLRASERLYYDNWGLAATSTDVRWVFDLGKRFAVWPHGRFHFQKGAVFWRRAYVSGAGWDLPLYRTGDRELGPLFTAQGGLGIKWYLGTTAQPERWSLGLSGDAMYTSFADTLYVTSRTAVLSSLDFEGAF